jgi:hypothetical protein
MKRVIMLSLALFLVGCCFCESQNFDCTNKNFYSEPIWNSDDLEISTGKSYIFLYQRDYFEHTDKIKEAIIKTTTTDKSSANRKYTVKYNDNGLPESGAENYYEDTYTEYVYDNQYRIIQWGTQWKYEYTAPFERNVYSDGKLYCTEKISFTDDGYIVSAVREISEYTRAYKFLNGVLQAVSTKIQMKKFDTIYEDWSFEYEDNKLIKIKEMKQGALIRLITVTKYETDNISEVQTVFYRKDAIDYTEKYFLSEYDSYGNWHKAESYMNGKLEKTTVRDIIYKE